MNPLAGLALKALAFAAVVAALFAWHLHAVDAAVKVEGDRVTALWNADRARTAAAAIKAQADAATETERRLTDKQGVIDATEKRLAETRADRDRLAAAVPGLHNAVAAAVARSGAVPRDPSAQCNSAAAATLGTLFEACAARYGALAADADDAVFRGLGCNAEYDSLSQHPASSAEGSE